VKRFGQLWREGDRAEFEIECSSGTYVRSLIADLGDAYCEELRRTAIGPFTVDEADEDQLLPLAEALDRLPEGRRGGDGDRVRADGDRGHQPS
jgi:tRNA pseudouridine55 synthase